MRKSTKNPVVDRFKRLQLFSACTRHEIGAVAAIGTGIRARAGQVLATEGSVGRQVFLVEEGRVAVERHGNRIAVLTAGAIAGETAVLSGAPRNATLVAETDLVVTVYTPAEFSELLAAVTPPA